MAKSEPKKKETRIVLSNAPDVVLSRKFELWCAYFLDKSNRTTYLNATQSALKVYDVGTKRGYFTAGQIGHENMKKLEMLRPMLADLEGFGIGERMKVAIAKAMKGTFDDWHRLLVQLGDFDSEKRIGVAIQNNFDFSNLGAMIAKDARERGLQP